MTNRSKCMDDIVQGHEGPKPALSSLLNPIENNAQKVHNTGGSLHSHVGIGDAVMVDQPGLQGFRERFLCATSAP